MRPLRQHAGQDGVIGDVRDRQRRVCGRLGLRQRVGGGAELCGKGFTFGGSHGGEV